MFRKQGHPRNSQEAQGWEETYICDTLNIFDFGETRTPILIVEKEVMNELKIYDARGNGDGETSCTLTGAHQANISDYTAIAVEPQVRVFESHAQDCRYRELGEVSQTVSATYESGGNNVPMVNKGAKVRRLTPLECERLQGYPDGWTDIGDWIDSKGKKHKGDADAPRYKALGNSIALPFWEWMANRMVKQLKADGVDQPTMASLFDGIGGFPLVYSRCGCIPVWASEIEEFPIAVTKVRFPEERSEEE